MTKPRVFLTRELPPESMRRLRAEADLTMNSEDRNLTKQELHQGIQNVDGLICLLTNQIDAELLDANPKLKVVSNFAVGFNNVDVPAATQRSVLITNTPGVLTESTADMAFALLMAASRRVCEGDRYVRSRQWKGWGPLQFLGTDIHGATLGLVGFGRIARAMVPRAKGFGMRVIYWNRTRHAEIEAEFDQQGVHYCPLDEVVAASDYLSVHVALNDETRHLIGPEHFERMKSSASIINTSRGAVIDEKAMAQALKSGQIAFAGLDVYENEPVLEPELYELQNAVLAPHLGSGTIATRTKMADMAIENCLAACSGRRPPNLVNPEAWSAT